MKRVSEVLDRVAAELESLADRLKQVSVLDGETAGGDVAVSPKMVVALQEIDRSEQLSRSLATILGRLAGMDLSAGTVDVTSLTEGAKLEHIPAIFQDRTRQNREEPVEFF